MCVAGKDDVDDDAAVPIKKKRDRHRPPICLSFVRNNGATEQYGGSDQFIGRLHRQNAFWWTGFILSSSVGNDTVASLYVYVILI